MAVVLWCVLGLLRERSSELRYAAACCGLALMVALPAATFARLAPAARLAAMQRVVVQLNMDVTVMADGSGGGAEPLKDQIKDALNAAAPWVPALWLAGVALFLVRLSIGLTEARRMKTGGTEPPPVELLRQFEMLRVQLGVTRAVKLLHSAVVQVPTVIGWLRPVVLIPVSCLTGLSGAQIEAILCHELAHIRRHDYLVSVFQSVVEALLFYHPAVWWVSREIRRERECCCDELAVAVGGDVLAYARALSYLEERRSLSTAIVLGANGGVLKMRIKRLLGSNDGAAVPQLPAILLLAIMVAGVCIGIAKAEPKESTDAVKRLLGLRTTEPIATEAILTPSDLLAMQAGPRAFAVSGAATQEGDGTPAAAARRQTDKAWLEQDVRWIITPEEAAAFQRLANDEERDAFIESFWAAARSGSVQRQVRTANRFTSESRMRTRILRRASRDGRRIAGTSTSCMESRMG